MNHKLYVRHLRRRWMLSQAELADLLDVDQGRVSRYETGEEYPSLSVALGLQVVFGRAPRACFSSLYGMVEDAVITRAARLERTLAGKRDTVSAKKLQLLTAMMHRATSRSAA